MNRRQFLVSLVAGSTGLAVSQLNWAQASPPLLMSAYKNQTGQYGIAAFSTTANKPLWQLPLPARAHAVSCHPSQPLAAVFDRRPGQQIHIIDWQQGKLLTTIKAAAKRHFYGHGTFSRDGKQLYCTENNWQHGTGVIGIYDTQDFTRLDEIASGGIGPHEIVLHPDGQTLVVANGGILTHPNSGRKKLNLDSMTPNLSHISIETGKLVDQQSFVHHQLSIRHLAISQQGQVVAGMQYQGDQSDIEPLVASQFAQGRPLTPLAGDELAWLQMNQYTASVCILDHADTVVITCPRANQIMSWQLSTGKLGSILNVADAAGAVAISKNHCAITTGLGHLHTIKCHQGSMTPMTQQRFADIAWDNHLALATI
ncbi:DUF1513 domain-containing protein [Endozoicomonas sp. SM1973]|uniref:DUF1513 domain-containing protein n=1 Tax=Spartinivicinus marinus TaxID=2994442 RepID=A0A853IDK2_9GAMM|nr:DUF1513 domain-containing protein [Spartinivicinus marinus]MCX4028373.1 DUF1513 domain-containing protein [Spartinivicinus marinus]NYZ68628.1 DUF1513 domain-containing protein [Spartinivicinus marinus]